LKKADHEMQSLQKNRTAAMNAITTLEKAYEWIADEKKWVVLSISGDTV
jgi:structural maintenance of chromosome 2